jgi:hypothetical protein
MIDVFVFPDEIATFTQTNRLAHLTATNSAYRVWILLGVVSKAECSGNGNISDPQFDRVLKTLKLSQNRKTRIIAAGMGIYWEVRPKMLLKRFGLARIISNLNALVPEYVISEKTAEKIYLPATDEGHKIALPWACFTDLNTFKAATYSSWFAKNSIVYTYTNKNSELIIHPPGTLISRATLRSLFGLDYTTQRQYEKRSKMVVTPALARVQGLTSHIPEEVFSQIPEDKHGAVRFVAEIAHNIPPEFSEAVVISDPQNATQGDPYFTQSLMASNRRNEKKARPLAHVCAANTYVSVQGSVMRRKKHCRQQTYRSSFEALAAQKKYNSEQSNNQAATEAPVKRQRIYFNSKEAAINCANQPASPAAKSEKYAIYTDRHVSFVKDRVTIFGAVYYASKKITG